MVSQTYTISFLVSSGYIGKDSIRSATNETLDKLLSWIYNSGYASNLWIGIG